jgi:hypothetical protein
MLKIHHRAGGIFWIAIGVYISISAYRLGLGDFHQPGPGFIFFLAALILTILGAIDFISSFIGRPKTEKGKTEKPIWAGVRWQKVLLVLVGLSLYTYLFNVLGFLTSTFLLMIFLFKGVEPTKWWISIVGSLITILISYGIFQLWLKVPFPQGFLGF